MELRKNKKLTQLELAMKLGVSDKAVSKWENGNTMPSIETIIMLSEFFSVSVDYFFDTEAITNKKAYAKPVQNSQYNKVVIMLLAVCLVWMCAVIIYVYSTLFLNIYYWEVFCWAVPVSAFVLMLFNHFWGKRIYATILSSIFVWGALASFYLEFLRYNFWLIFILGVPAQITIVLWYKLKIK